MPEWDAVTGLETKEMLLQNQAYVSHFNTQDHQPLSVI